MFGQLTMVTITGMIGLDELQSESCQEVKTGGGFSGSTVGVSQAHFRFVIMAPFNASNHIFISGSLSIRRNVIDRWGCFTSSWCTNNALNLCSPTMYNDLNWNNVIVQHY